MSFQFTHPEFLVLLPVVWAWVIWLALKSDVQIGSWRRWTAMAVRLLVALLLVLAIAGIRWMKPLEGVNVFFLLDRSDSVPSVQQEASRKMVNRYAEEKRIMDKSGLLVFATDAALESTASEYVDPKETKVLAVIPTDRSDLGSAIRLGTAAFPETGQKRLVLISDGNENLGDAMTALLQARPLGVSLDVLPLGVERGNDVSVQKLGLPSRVKKGQTFETKIFVAADRDQAATLRLYRDEQPLGEQTVNLTAGKNLFTFPQTLSESGFYAYTVQLEAKGDNIPQNNKATSFVNVRGDPRVLVISFEPEQDRSLVEALLSSKLEVKSVGITGFPASLAEMQSYDAVFISNLAAGDLGTDNMRLLESAVRDFGVGLVCIGGDQTYAAGGYRNTPLESTLPVNMELDSKKVLPKGAIALVMHGMEFGNGNQVARDCALGVLDALGPQDELGVVLWDGAEQWLVDLSPVGNKKEHGRRIAGMNQGDLPGFQGVMSLAYQALKKSTANLKHMIVFSDGDPGAPLATLMRDIVAARITVSTVLISGHAAPDTMIAIADQGNGEFYNIKNPNQLPQIFIKEAAVILKSAIFEEPFTPRVAAGSELTRGIGAYPVLNGYVCTTPKPRAELPLISDKGDPLLAHWQYGLGRAVAWTSDAKPRWAKNWLSWGQYRQFWSQIAQWSLRRLENSDYAAEVAIESGEGHLTVEALDERGDYRNFLNLQTVVVSPKGERVTLRLEQTGPGRYEARFPTREVGSYLMNLMETRDGKLASSQVVGASVNYSPEFTSPEPNLPLLRRLSEAGNGRMLEWPSSPDTPITSPQNPFLHDRRRTFQPVDWWESLLKWGVLFFVLDVGLRRIQLEREELRKMLAWAKRTALFWRGIPRPVESDQSLAALLARRDAVRTKTPSFEARPELFQPVQTPVLPGRAPTPPASTPAVAEEPAQQPLAGGGAPESTTSRLLEAKRRARKSRD
ncbi:MAG TPA: glutamine amidotransferase [Verrucomicrobiae bacterium]|nr:glutamine amidotransferase [Verrucomicrobiae bacterium]